MPEIILSNGKIAQIDEEDADLCEFPWAVMSEVYGYRRVNNLPVFLHKVIAERIGIVNTIADHIDRNPLNCRRSNFRPATHQQNCCNRETTGPNFRGVSYSEERQKFVAQIKVKGCQIPLGRFRTDVEAAEAYDRAAKLYFGEFAQPNFK